MDFDLKKFATYLKDKIKKFTNLGEKSVQMYKSVQKCTNVVNEWDARQQIFKWMLEKN